MPQTILDSRPIILYPQPADPAIAGQCDCNCDCACAAPAVENARRAAAAFQAPQRRYLRAESARFDVSQPGYSARYSAGAALAVLNEPAETLLGRFARPIPLTETPAGERAAVERLIAAGMLLPEGEPLLAPPGAPDTLTAWLHLTERCNLRCEYCYLPKRPVDMNLETGQRAIDALLRSAAGHGFRRLRIKYAGGEPLLRFDTLSRLHCYAQSCAARRAIQVEGVVLSNGILLDAERVETLRQLGLQLMISLDSFSPHDHRQTASQRPSFPQAQQAIRLAAGRLTVFVSMTLTHTNLPYAPAALEWLLRRPVQVGINFYRPNRRITDPDPCMLTEQDAGLLADLYRQQVECHPERSLLGAWLDRANLGSARLRPCGVGESYVVIDSQGRAARCQMALEAPRAPSEWDDLLDNLDQTGCEPQNPPVTDKENCQGCLYRYACSGGCPLLARLTHGRYDQPSAYCHLYRAVFPRLIVLEGQRLLATAAPALCG